MSSLYRRPKRNGIYWLSFRYNGRPYNISLKTKDRSTAVYLKAQKDKELIEGKSIIPDKNLSCLIILDRYKKDFEYLREAKSGQRQYSRLKKFFEWAHILKFKDITQNRLRDYLTHRINLKEGDKDKITLVTANTLITHVKTFLNWCVKNRYVFENPIAGIAKYKIPQKDVRFLSKEEIKKLLDTAQEESLYCDGETTLYPVIAAGIYSGLRQGELFNLEWQDIDWTNNLIKVKNKEGFTTKNKKNRTVPLHAQLRAILKPLAQKTGACFDSTNARRIFGRIRDKAKMPDIGWHTLRHTFASQALMARIPLSTVSKWLGHSSVTTTMVYSHLLEDHEQAEIKKLEF